MASDLVVPNSNFVQGEASDADAVDANFTAIVQWINTNAAHLDAGKAFTQIPVVPAVDPTTDNMVARKLYVDNKVATEATARAAADATLTTAAAAAQSTANTGVANAATAQAAATASAQGYVALERTFTNVGTSGAAGNVTMMTTTPTLTAGRTYKISWAWYAASNLSVGTTDLIMYFDGNEIARTRIGVSTIGDLPGGSSFVVVGTTSGPHAVTLNLSTDCSSGALIYAGATQPFTLLVEDMGS